MNLLLLCLVGLLCGLHAATWGGFKDSPFEGFRPVSFLRSVLLGLGSALVVGLATNGGPAPSALVLIGLCYALERLATEWWKSILREDDQDAYSIPMRLAVRGRPIERRGERYAVGAAIAAGLVLLWWSARAVQGATPLPAWAVMLVGGVGGWLTAVGGAWKDAPVEGFSGWKFLRSPVVATAWAVVLSPFTQDGAVLVVAAGGWSVISIETYKTFLTGGRPPGKFAGKPVRHVGSAAREGCRAAHVLLYAGFALSLGLGLVPTTAPRGGIPTIGQLLASAAVTLAASAAAGLVLICSPAGPSREGARGRMLQRVRTGR